MSIASLTKQRLVVDGKQVAFHERGRGDAIVFLHGNPTSSYLWRDVLPHVAEHGRCIAPDLIGHGDSAKLDVTGPESYSFVEHRHYLDGLLEQLDLGARVTLVLHDWGSALGFDWARRHPDRVVGIAYMEAIVAPMSWDDWPEAARSMFRALRSTAGEQLILEENLFIEGVLPASVIRDLSDEEMAQYRRPFATPGEARRPTLTWPRELPIDGQPAGVVEIVEAYADWMGQTHIPKLFINADPGTVLTGPRRDFCRTWSHQTEVTVSGLHLIQEDSPDLIGAALSAWLADEVRGQASTTENDSANATQGLSARPKGGQ